MSNDLICYGCLESAQIVQNKTGIWLHPRIVELLRPIYMEGVMLSVVVTGKALFSVNIYGPRKDSVFVSSQLNDAGVFLGHPHTVTLGVPYKNPHWPYS
ncbi:hypothetical protein PT974_02912 [Cladobotryum mycophilum]|uniref:Uncharacterized protein n=1 Tax=Cladobotryum mycophilum TaxID=491253 RepID=A0ABR0SZY9_9HYPO